MKKVTSLLALISCATLLTACGGGGGDSAATPGPVASNPTPPVVAPSNPTPPAVTPASLQTTVPAPTYAAASEEMAFFNAYNDFRAKVGLGLLAQSKELDLASANHVNYLLTNSDIDFSKVSAHEETATRPGFTGVNSLERAKFAKYAGTFTAEQITYGDGASGVYRLLATVYHRATMMNQGARDLGVKVGGNAAKDTVMVLGGSQGNLQRNASDFVTGYPYDKQTNVGRTTWPESPNPYQDLTLNDYATKTSFPVSFTSEASTTLKVETFTITEAGQSAPLDVRLITADNDYQKMVPANFAFIVGRAPFKANTTYNVVFKGTANGAAVSKSWSFTTGQ